MPPQQHIFPPSPNPGNGSATLQHDAANYGSLPQSTATFSTLPQGTAAFGNERQTTERSENHTLTVKEVAACSKLPAFLELSVPLLIGASPINTGSHDSTRTLNPNERRYLITTQSVDRSIKEEIAKGSRTTEPSDANAADRSAREPKNRNPIEDADGEAIAHLRFKLRESEISSSIKDQIIAKLEERYDKAHEKLENYSRTLGQLETRLLQLEGPREESAEPKRVHVISQTEYPNSEHDVERPGTL